MGPRFLPLLIAAAILSGCGSGVSVEDLATARFAEFQTALFARDRATLKRIVCRDARAVVPDLCRAPLDGRLPLVVTGVSRNRHEYRVHVTDPNQKGAAKDSFYVLAKEDGQLRVDLLTTLSYHRPTTGPRVAQPSFAPGKLTPEQVRQARAALPPSDR